MKLITAEEMLALLKANIADARYERLREENYDQWVSRTVLLSIEGVTDGSNAVISEEEWARLKGILRDYCLQAGLQNDEVSS